MDRTPRATGSTAKPTAVTLVLFALLASMATGCAMTRQQDVKQASSATVPADTAHAEDPQDSNPVEIDTWIVEETPLGADEPAAPALPSSGDPFHDDQATASPFDELAEVDPESLPAGMDENLDPLADAAPTFDIPIEINDRVLAWVERYSGEHRHSFEKGLARSGRYIDMFRRIFAEEGVPQDMAYMAHVESGYKTTAYSRAHARGIYQFISSTARLYDLRVDYWVDERADPEKSARAAARYMKKLYGDFGDWYLALAAYNAGEGKIGRAISGTGSRDFWTIAKSRYIRRETKNHVPAVIAATLLTKEPEKYGLTFTPDPPVQYETVQVDGAADLNVLARCAGTDSATLKFLNPAIRRTQTPPDSRTDVRVPVGTAATTLAALHAIPREDWVLYAFHRVKSGDTLSRISKNYGVSVRAIQDSNSMGRRTLIRVNQVLKVPTSSASRYANVAVNDANVHATGEVVNYRVRRGDTLYGIGRRYGTTAKAIAAASNIAVNDTLSIGKRLTVVPGVRSTASAQRIARGAGSSPGGDSARVHTVRRGDTLWDIATMYKTSVNVLCSMNQISPSAILRPGNRLTVGYE